MQENKKSTGSELVNVIRNILPTWKKKSFPEELNKSFFEDPLFVRIMGASPTAIAIFNYSTMLYEYFSPSMESLLAYPIEKLHGYSGAEFAFNTFHPDHLTIVVKQMEKVKKFYYEYAKQKRVLDSRYTFTLQLKRGTGQYIWTLMQTVVLEINKDGLPCRSMILVTDITDIKSNSKVDFSFALKNPDGMGYETIFVSHHEPSTEYILTGREIDVLNCVAKGMRNHEIADKLNISKNTVITHRRNIMKKTGKENIIQLLVD